MPKQRKNAITKAPKNTRIDRMMQDRLDAIKANADSIKNFERYLSLMVQKTMSDDDLGMALRFHMALDYAITYYVRSHMPIGAYRYILLSEKTSFGVKLAYAVALGLPIYVAEVCKQINDVRNSFAHPSRNGEMEISFRQISALEPSARELFTKLRNAAQEHATRLDDLQWAWSDDSPDADKEAYGISSVRRKFAIICSLCLDFFGADILHWEDRLRQNLIDDIKALTGDRFSELPQHLLENLRLGSKAKSIS